jgi:cyclophilin family peptidyl-prolyl cis-trans isomerase
LRSRALNQELVMFSVKVLALCFVVLGMVAANGARAANPVVAMETSMGTIKIELDEAKAPVTVKNFLGYVKDKHYDGTIFHRVIDGFMIQGGGFEPGMKQKKTKEPIKNESNNGLSNSKYTIAMARTSDPDSATAQFYINVKDNKALDGANGQAGYAVFGKVIEGADVVDKIKAVKTGTKAGHRDVPLEDVVIKSVKVVEEKK